MLVYNGTKNDFMNSVENDTIAYEIQQKLIESMNRHTARNEFMSWENSLQYMYKVLNDKEIPIDSGIAIEYNIPQTSKELIFLLVVIVKHKKKMLLLLNLNNGIN